MLRLALIPFALVVAVLVLLAVIPSRENLVPGGAVELQDVVVTLYPRTDPDAVWYFATPRADYSPSTQEATLHSVEDGRRTVAGETDFTLHSQQVTIDRSENLRGDEMRAHLVEDDLDLVMQARADRQVLIDQRNGRFEVPRAIMSGPDLGESIFEDMRISFDFTDFESGGPGTVGYAQFMVDVNGEN